MVEVEDVVAHLKELQEFLRAVIKKAESDPKFDISIGLKIQADRYSYGELNSLFVAAFGDNFDIKSNFQNEVIH